MSEELDRPSTAADELRPLAEGRGERALSRSLGVGFVIFVALGLVILLGYGFFRGGGESGPKQAPDFTIELFDGGTLTLSEMRGRPVVLNLWASWCPPCREEMPVLEEGWRTYGEQGVVFLGVNVRDNESDARSFLQEVEVTYLNGRDADGKIYNDYGATGVPETFFISRDGLILYRFIGPLSKKQLAALVEDLLL